MKYTPIQGPDEAVEKIAGLGFNHFVLYTYEDHWQREDGEPGIETVDDVESAAGKFLEACRTALCVELRGIGLDGCEYPISIGGLTSDLSEEGEYIEE